MAAWTRNLRNLFFIRRVPKTHIPLFATVPPKEDKAAYVKHLDDSGFISPEMWQEEDLGHHPVLAQDLNDLEEHLLPTFFDFDQKARHYQNRFYLYQWIFIWGAFLTTLFGILTTYSYVLVDKGGVLAMSLGIMTALISAITAFFNILADQGKPQRHWTRSRRLAEELRMTYYRYLAHIDPYHEQDRQNVLRKMVTQIQQKERDNV